MLDVLMRSLGFDQAKMQSMMENAQREYELRIKEFHDRFDKLETLLTLAITKLEGIENGKSNAGVGATQQQFAESIGGNVEFIEPGSGVLQPLHPGAGTLGGPIAPENSAIGNGSIHGIADA